MKKVILWIVSVVITVAIILVAGSLFLIHRAQKEYKNQIQTQQKLNAPIEIPEEGVLKFSDVKDFEKPIVTMFYVDWCGYCRRYMPIFGKLAKKYEDKYNFAVVDCDEPENTEFYKKMGVMGFPTLFIIDKKHDFHFSLNMAGTQDNKIMLEELDRYLILRAKIKS